MRVLVAGAHGLTGRRILRQLQSEAHEAVAISRKKEQEKELKAFGAISRLVAQGTR
jgi:uncharacterized protein YbjT (DUF2867 family)